MNLPSDIRSILAGHDIADTDALAEAADRIWEARTASANVQHISDSTSPTQAPTEQTATSEETVSAIKSVKPRRGPPSQQNTANSVCYYHQRFGPDARHVAVSLAANFPLCSPKQASKAHRLRETPVLAAKRGSGQRFKFQHVLSL